MRPIQRFIGIRRGRAAPKASDISEITSVRSIVKRFQSDSLGLRGRLRTVFMASALGAISRWAKPAPHPPKAPGGSHGLVCRYDGTHGEGLRAPVEISVPPGGRSIGLRLRISSPYVASGFLDGRLTPPKRTLQALNIA
jgi:hypothetical protein